MSKLHPTITSADVRQSHTLGPWSTWDDEIVSADGTSICVLLAHPKDADKWGHHHADANERLIRAAPDMLAMLVELVETVTLCRDCDWHVLNKEYVELLTTLEHKAKAITNTVNGGAA